jgi:hypothetical protein
MKLMGGARPNAGDRAMPGTGTRRGGERKVDSRADGQEHKQFHISRFMMHVLAEPVAGRPFSQIVDARGALHAMIWAQV